MIFGRAIVKKRIGLATDRSKSESFTCCRDINTMVLFISTEGNIPASSSLSSLALESSDSLLPPLGSHDSRFDGDGESRVWKMEKEGGGGRDNSELNRDHGAGCQESLWMSGLTLAAALFGRLVAAREAVVPELVSCPNRSCSYAQ